MMASRRSDRLGLANATSVATSAAQADTDDESDVGDESGDEFHDSSPVAGGTTGAAGVKGFEGTPSPTASPAVMHDLAVAAAALAMGGGGGGGGGGVGTSAPRPVSPGREHSCTAEGAGDNPGAGTPIYARPCGCGAPVGLGGMLCAPCSRAAARSDDCSVVCSVRGCFGEGVIVGGNESLCLNCATRRIGERRCSAPGCSGAADREHSLCTLCWEAGKCSQFGCEELGVLRCAGGN